MSLQTLVKAGNITNLSDARYCAGMGVEIIGFPVGKSNPLALDTSKIKEITGWLSGIKIAVELAETDFHKQAILDILQELNPDYIQTPVSLVKSLKEISTIPLLITSDFLSSEGNEQDCLLYTGSISGKEEAVANYSKSHKLILSGIEIKATTILTLLTKLKPYGIELKGGTEISPGLKDFDELSEILELLEVDE